MKHMKIYASLLLLLFMLSAAPFISQAEAKGKRAYRVYKHRSSYSSGYYTNVDGNRIRRPVQASSAPAGATAQCRDGSYSFSANHRGTCSHHAGVARWLR